MFTLIIARIAQLVVRRLTDAKVGFAKRNKNRLRE